MYKREPEGWLKHIDFILLDMLCLQFAFCISYIIRGEGINPYYYLVYRNMAIVLEMADLTAIFLLNSLHQVMQRKLYHEFSSTIKNCICVGMIALAYLFAVQEGSTYSRFTFAVTLLLHFVFTLGVRLLWKHMMKSSSRHRNYKSLLLVTTLSQAEEVVCQVQTESNGQFLIHGLVIVDREAIGQMLGGVPVVADRGSVPEYICQQWIDEVLIVLPNTVEYPMEMMEKIEETGVTVHLNLTGIENNDYRRQFVEKIASYTVLTTSLNSASAIQLMLKRLMDILGGLVGCVITGILFLFVAPAIYISSPGPIFFSQERIGRNGKRFKIYKFRSMYMDAEARKQELMSQNQMGDGRMFKMDFDPRVIGNKVLPDGTKKTGIGHFIRETSIDEFPQFFNVLKGDMSIVGTRPPLPGEVSQYELHHRARLAIKPGITGMWQVSGRSSITDFEEIVNLDTRYIREWSLWLDIKILLRTVYAVLGKKGAV